MLRVHKLHLRQFGRAGFFFEAVKAVHGFAHRRHQRGNHARRVFGAERA